MEWVYDAQSWKGRRLLCESVPISIDKWNLALKNDGARSFSYETKSLMSFILSGEWVYGDQLWKERGLLCESVFVLIDKWTLCIKINGKKAFLLKPKY